MTLTDLSTRRQTVILAALAIMFLPVLAKAQTVGSVRFHTGAEIIGGSAGGGGTQIESAFRLRAMALADQIAEISDANSICPAPKIRAALAASQIRVVEELEVPAGTNTGDLDAYTHPGDIQLLQHSWDKFLDPKVPQVGQSVDLLILHESLRTTGNACGDDNFNRSTKIYKMLESNSSQNRGFDLSKYGVMECTEGVCAVAVPSLYKQTKVTCEKSLNIVYHELLRTGKIVTNTVPCYDTVVRSFPGKRDVVGHSGSFFGRIDFH